MPDMIKKLPTLISASILFILLAQCGFYLLHNARFVFSDEHQFLDILMKNSLPFPTTMGNGRFWPLLFQEYRLYLLNISEPNIIIGVMHAHNFVKLILTITFICLSLRKFISTYISLLTCAIVLIYSRFFLIYSWSQGTESTIIMLWAFWFCLATYAFKTDKAIYFISASLVASLAFYLKETAFILFTPASIAIILLNYKNISLRAKAYHITVICSFLIYIALYYFFAYKTSVSFYNIGRSQLNIPDILINYITTYKIIIICILIFILRCIYFHYQRKIKINIADALLLNSLLFILGYALLKLSDFYYVIPAIPSLIISIVLYINMAYSFIKEKNIFDISGYKKKIYIHRNFDHYYSIFISSI